MSRKVNHEYDDRQGPVIDWQEHIGLVYVAANIACDQVPQLRPHFQDIADRLRSKLWELARPVSEGGTYNSTVSRFSTYAVVSMVRYCRRELKEDILGVGDSEAKGRGAKIVNMHSTHDRGSGRPLAWMIPAKDHDPSQRVDAQYLAAVAIETMDGDCRESLMLTAVHENTQRDAAVAVGLSRQSVGNRIADGVGIAQETMGEAV